jgi:hypothetical protein
VARQNIGQENRERLPATAAVSAIRTKDPLSATQAAAIVFGGIVAVEDAVPVQRFILAAAWTALLFEGKSSSFSFSASATKRNGGDMGRVAAEKNAARPDPFDGSSAAGLDSERFEEKGGRH